VRTTTLSIIATLALAQITIYPGASGIPKGTTRQMSAYVPLSPKIIKLRNTSGMRRQVFFFSVGGFDTHGAQAWQQWDLFKQISDAMNAFYLSTQELGVANDVTTFTESEFGRSLQPSGSGSDHGWGSHFRVLGGAVQGGDLSGQFPDLSLVGPDDSGNRGTLLLSTELDQYGATLSYWFGFPTPRSTRSSRT